MRVATARTPSLLIVVLIVVQNACTWKGTRDAGQEADHPLVALWRSVPASLQIYPSTRFTDLDGQTVLEAHIEMLDEMGDSIKGTGRFRLELLAPGDGGSSGLRPPLYTWNVTLLTLDEQRCYYNTITRGYVLQLKMSQLPDDLSQVTLHVTFYAVDDGRLEAEAVVKAQTSVRKKPPID